MKVMGSDGAATGALQSPTAQRRASPRRAGPRRTWLAAGLLVAGSLFAGACTTVETTEGGAIGIDRKQRMSTLVSEEELDKGAIAAYNEILTKEKKEGDLNAEPAMTARVRAIAQRLIPQTAVFRPDATKWNWEVNVIKSDELNAWCMPGGKIAFYSGIITKLKLTDDEIAAIMGHEIAHALREHARERASEQATTGLVVGVGAAILGAGQLGADLTQMAYHAVFGLKHSRLHETEADRIGVELAARAGYDPRAAITLWEKMSAAAGSGGGPEFLSTHPSPESRIADLRDYSARVMPLYEKARQ
jgi:predicted Zn-dependent protease